MSTLFSRLVLTNNNSIDIDIELEAPIGTSLITSNVGPNATKTIPININDIRTAKIIVSTTPHTGYSDTMTIDLSSCGSPYQLFIESIEAMTSIGSIHGKTNLMF